MVDVRVFVLMQMLIIGNAFDDVERPTKNLLLIGENCSTQYVERGKCMNITLCDPSFVHSLPYDHHSPVCRQNAFVKVLCCQPFLDFCKTPINTQILGGDEAKEGMFPHIARLGKKNDQNVIEWSCSANIISVKFLLTAAHCKPEAKIVGAGCTAPGLCEQQINITNFMSYPGYKTKSKYHDIALVELSEELRFNKDVLPICPYYKMNDLPQEENLTIAGWGSTGSFTNQFSQRLLYATLWTVPMDACRNVYQEILPTVRNKLANGITVEQYCARGSFLNHTHEYIDACTGDSGGPLQVKESNMKYLVGVVTSGVLCGSKYPGLYARVAAYFDWINTTITRSQSVQRP